jgi:hypothetical protein
MVDTKLYMGSVLKNLPSGKPWGDRPSAGIFTRKAKQAVTAFIIAFLMLQTERNP